MNLLFFLKSLRSPSDEVEDDSSNEVEALEKFDSTNRVVEDRLGKSGSGLWDKGGRSFENKVVDKRRSTLDGSLDGDESRLGNLEGKEGSFKVVNSFFETKECYFE